MLAAEQVPERHGDKGETSYVCNIVKAYFFQWLLQPIQGPGLFFSSVIIFTQTVGLLGRVISPLQGHYLNTGQHKHRINAYPHQTSMPWVGFEPTIPTSERAKAVHALDRAATVTGIVKLLFFFPLALQSQFGPWPTFMKLSISLRFTRS
jgi:hypothetical protein